MIRRNDPPVPPQPGLRERKKARTRASIREHALRLFREQGYQATTVEQIAAAAEVSPSTFFRYFPTKEDVVLQDDMDTRMIEALERQPAGLSPLGAVRAAIREVFTGYSAADIDVLSQTDRAHHDRSRGTRPCTRRVRPDDQRDRRGGGQACGALSGRPGSPGVGRRDRRRDHVDHHARGRDGPTGRRLRTRSSASRRDSPCWRPACRCANWRARTLRGEVGYSADPPVARRIRSVSRSIESSVPPALPYSCW